MKLFKKTYTTSELIEGCKKNNRKCQEALYMKYFDEMYKMCFRYLKEEESTLDVLNTGFLKVFEKIDSFRAKGSFEGWVRRIIYHTMVEHFRSQRSYQTFIVLEPDESHPNTKKVPASALEELYYEELLELLAELPPKSALVFRMHAIEGYSHREIGNELNMSENTSKWYLAKARKELQDRIKKNSKNKTIA
ncbi:MAG: sigma-70 family RNA polymerase sigma factor [Bacteroidetes bacterium]|nr:sigma-70 family RNA polymerase sigma factor [Bacteroidota bacterium]